jgi:hypothetical protein
MWPAKELIYIAVYIYGVGCGCVGMDEMNTYGQSAQTHPHPEAEELVIVIHK